MKHHIDDLRSALPGEPESCRIALLQAARSVKEDEPMKKHAFRTILIAALLIAAMTVMALAAASTGLVDWFQNAYRTSLPETAQEALSATQASTLETDVMTFTVNELLCDGKIAYMTVEAQLKEGKSAILCTDGTAPWEPIGAYLAQMLNHPQLSESSTYAEAAKITGLPVYNVSAWMEPGNDVQVNSEMMDSIMQENGRMLLVRMMYFNNPITKDSLPVTIVAQVQAAKADTLELIENSEQCATEKRTIPVHGVIAERSYKPVEAATLSEHFTLTGVEARQTCAGVYLTICTTLSQPMTRSELFDTDLNWIATDMQGNRFPIGVSLTGEYLNGNGQSLNTAKDTILSGFQYMFMTSIEELPENFIITDGTTRIEVK